MPERYRNSCGPRIRKFRIERGLTQEQLAARLQLAGLYAIDRVALAKIESQIRSLFDYELVLIASVLDQPVTALVPSKETVQRQLKRLKPEIQ